MDFSQGNAEPDSLGRNLIDVLEPIFDNLDLPDLKSASLVCRAWLEGTVKAFEHKTSVEIKAPDETTTWNLKQTVGRFRRHKILCVHFGYKAVEPVSEFLQLAKQLRLLTNLDLHYEGTFKTVACVNQLLSELKQGCFPQLNQLALRPYGEISWILIGSPIVPGGSVNVQRNASQLQVLRVNASHPSILGLDWSFVKGLTELKELHVLQLDFAKGNFEPQMKNLVANLNSSIEGLELYLGVYWNQDDPESWLTSNIEATRSLLNFVKPSSFGLIVHTPFSTYNKIDPRKSFEKTCSLIPKTGLSRFSIHMMISISDPDRALSCSEPRTSMGWVYELTSKCFKNYRMTILSSFDIDFAGQKTFLEFEATTYAPEMCVRRGPSHGESESYFMSMLVIQAKVRLGWQDWHCNRNCNRSWEYRFKDGRISQEILYLEDLNCSCSIKIPPRTPIYQEARKDFATSPTSREGTSKHRTPGYPHLVKWSQVFFEDPSGVPPSLPHDCLGKKLGLI